MAARLHRTGCCLLRCRPTYLGNWYLREQLLQNEFSASGETTKFAQELFARVQHKETTLNVKITWVHV